MKMMEMSINQYNEIKRDLDYLRMSRTEGYDRLMDVTIELEMSKRMRGERVELELSPDSYEVVEQISENNLL